MIFNSYYTNPSYRTLIDTVIINVENTVKECRKVNNADQCDDDAIVDLQLVRQYYNGYAIWLRFTAKLL